MAKKKKINGISVAIVALNIVIVGIVILLVVLVYLHMKEDADNGRTDSSTTTPAVSDSETITETEPPQSSESTAEETTPDTEETTEDTAEEITWVPTGYDRGFFDNDLFIGDSIFTGLYLYGFLDKDNVFAEVGLNPESAVYNQIDGITCVDKAASMQPRNIYIMLGTNGLAFFEGSYMANKMVELIAELESACPTAAIYIMTIPPVTAVHEADGQETMTLVNTYNSHLKNMCSQGGYDCIDLCTLLQDENGYLSVKYAEADGLHFLGDAYIAMLSYVEQCANSD